VDPVDAHLTRAVADLRGPDGHDLPAGLPGPRLLELFDVQAGSRHLDLAARELRAGAGLLHDRLVGHEGNAAVAAALRPTDPALLHYRSGAFYLERARQVDGVDGLRDVLLGLVAAPTTPSPAGGTRSSGATSSP
jgi:2-oxoisovalerate dehydrogenase E1 component